MKREVARSRREDAAKKWHGVVVPGQDATPNAALLGGAFAGPSRPFALKAAARTGTPSP
jgi:hypothetical protein